MTDTPRRTRWPRAAAAVIVLAAVSLAPIPTPGADAAEDWKKRCAMCHGKDGKPTPVGVKMGAKDVTSEEVQAKPDASLARTVAEGSGKMPGYADQMTAEEIDALIAYVRELAGSDD